MEKIEFPSYEAMVDSESLLVKQFPGLDLKLFQKFHYFEMITSFFGLGFYSFYFLVFLIHGKTYFRFNHTFCGLFVVQIVYFLASSISQKVSFVVNSIEYYTFDTITFFPKLVLSICDKITISQLPIYWFSICCFLIIQIAEFTNRKSQGIKFAHFYLVPIGFAVFLISLSNPEHMEIVMIVVCFLIWWIYRKHMAAQLYSQEMSAKDVLNMRRLNIWLSSQIFITLLFHLLGLGATMTIKSSVMDSGRQIYYHFHKNQMFKGIALIGTYVNAMLFGWATIHFVKSGKTETTLPVILNASVPLESFSRRPSSISAFSMNNVAPLTPRENNMLHI